ncbi:MAG TPA: hypothetical protein VJ023_07900 [Pyrinomonadaceae bacterium]|nr:hypothetical protein [Pyrinomonadaceae bacterium]
MMSKQISSTLAFLLGLGLLAAATFTFTVAGAATPQTAGAATTRNTAVVAATVAILKETSEIRELEVLRPVKSGAQTRADIERMIIRNLNEQTTPAEMRASEVGLKKLGLVPPDFEYRAFIIKLLTEQVAGYYDTKTREFYLADWIELEGQKPVMAHELTHALQDQHFNLQRFEKWPKGDSDAELAAHALIEGDATLAMTLYMARNPLIALAFVRSLGATQNSTEQLKRAPRVLRESLVFPYEQGSEWATKLYRRGGWAEVSGAYKKLPLSTEHIMHPDKYHTYEVPVKVTLPDLRPLLGAGWNRIDYDVTGEWGYYLFLDEFLNNTAASKRAAAGWAGDRYALYEGPKTEVLIAQLTAWDTPADAQEFYDAYARRTELRYQGAKEKEPGMSSVGGQQRRVWSTAEGLALIEIRGDRVLIIEGIPEGANTDALLRLIEK